MNTRQIQSAFQELVNWQVAIEIYFLDTAYRNPFFAYVALVTMNNNVAICMFV